jgi:hypothetical protein
MLLSVVSTKTATPCHQIQNRQINLGSVVCRSIHSTTHDLAKPSSQRRDLVRSVSFPTRLDQHFSLQAAIAVVPQRKSVASIHMRWSKTPSLRAKGNLGALHAATFRHFERPALQAGKPRRSRQHDMRRLEGRGSDHRVADLADTSMPVGLAGLIFLGGQPKIGTDRTRFSEACRIVDRRPIC